MKAGVYIILMFFVLLVNATEQDESATCNFLKIDSTLNKVYKQILTEYKSDTLFLRKLKEAQKLWVKFRDAHLEAVFPTSGNTGKNIEYGSIYSDCACDILSTLTTLRIKQLQKWLDGAAEGEGCAGSYKTK